MAIDPTAPVHPIIPTVPAGTAVDSSAILQALARQALAGSTAQLADMAGQTDGKAAQVQGQAPSAAQAATQDAGHSAGALDGRPTPAQGAPAPAPSRPPLDSRTARVVRQATAEAVPRQAGLAPLMADLQAMIDQPDAPPEVRDAGRALLSTTPTIADITTAPGLRRAVERSGVLLETHLARAAASSPPPANAPRPMIAEGDLKAALWVFRGALSAWLAKVEPPSGDASPHVAPDPEGGPSPEPDPLRPVGRETTVNGARSNPSSTTLSLPGQAGLEADAVEIPSPNATRAPPLKASAEADNAPPARAVTPAPARTLEQDADPELAARFGAFVALPQKTAERPPIKAATAGVSLPAQVQLEPPDAEGEPPPAAPTEPRARMTRGYAAAAEERSKTPPPPYAGGPTAGQKPMEPSPLLMGAPEAMARRLLKGTQSALARQDLMQIASLPESVVHEQEAAEPRALSTKLNFDLPFVTPQGVAVAQFEISRDGGGAGGGGPAALEQTYRARFSIDVEPLGPVHAQVVLAGARARVSLWAERSETIARLRAGEEALGAALRQADLTPEVAVHSGAPPTPGNGPVGHFVDQAS